MRGKSERSKSREVERSRLEDGKGSRSRDIQRGRLSDGKGSRSRDIERSRSRDGKRSRSRDIERSRSRGGKGSRSRDIERSRSRDRRMNTSRGTERSRSRDGKRGRSRDIELSRSRNHKRSRSRDNERSRSRDRQRSRSRGRQRSRSRDRQRSRSRDHQRSRSRDHRRSIPRQNKRRRSRDDKRTRSSDESENSSPSEKRKSKSEERRKNKRKRKTKHRNQEKEKQSTHKHSKHKKLKKHKQKYHKRKSREAVSSSSSWSTSSDSDDLKANDEKDLERKTQRIVSLSSSEDSAESEKLLRKSEKSTEKFEKSCRISQKSTKTSEKSSKLREKSTELSETTKDRPKENFRDVEENTNKGHSCNTECCNNCNTALDRSSDSNKSSKNTFLSKRIEIKISSDVVQTQNSHQDSGNRRTSGIDLIGKWEPVEKESLKAFTDLCKTLVEEEQHNVDITKSKKSKDDEITAVRHPFIVEPKPPLIIPAIPQNPAQAIQSGTIYQIVGNIEVNPKTQGDVTSNFPVSSGLQHRKKESNETANDNDNTPVFNQSTQKININELIAERLKVQNELRENPFDFKSQLKLRTLDDSINAWSKTGLKPEQFTGEKTKNILRKEDLEGGYCAWARKDFFCNLQPITDGKGMEMLQKMGWRQGQPLGKKREGFVNPIQLEVRTDRKGLSTAGEDIPNNRNKKRPNTFIDIQGKHPVSALAEMCSKRKWLPPDYKVTMDTGPSHNKKYLFTVTVNGIDFLPTSPSPNKKTAKAQAASVALAQIVGNN